MQIALLLSALHWLQQQHTECTWFGYPVHCNPTRITSMCVALSITKTIAVMTVLDLITLSNAMQIALLLSAVHCLQQQHTECTWFGYPVHCNPTRITSMCVALSITKTIAIMTVLDSITLGSATQIALLPSRLHYLLDQTWLTYFGQCDTRRIPSICVTLAVITTMTVFTGLDLATLGKYNGYSHYHCLRQLHKNVFNIHEPW